MTSRTVIFAIALLSCLALSLNLDAQGGDNVADQKGVPHRLFGYTIADHQYLLLIGCTHNAKKYEPPDAMETARKRREQINNQEATFVEYKLIFSR